MIWGEQSFDVFVCNLCKNNEKFSNEINVQYLYIFILKRTSSAFLKYLPVKIMK